MIGIYKITNIINNKIYIGQSVNCAQRWKDHQRSSQNSICLAKNKRDYNTPIHRAIRKYGVENFKFEILEECSQEELNDKERFWINFYKSNTSSLGYNLTGGGQENFDLKGENHSQAKLTQKEVNEIYNLLQNNLDMSIHQISEKFKVSPSLISLINNGRNWKNEELNYPLRPVNYSLPGEKNPRAKLTADIVREMRFKWGNGIPPKQIFQEYYERYGVKERTLRAALYGESWKNI